MKKLTAILAVAFLAAVSAGFTVTNNGGQTSRSHIRAIPEGGGAGRHSESVGQDGTGKIRDKSHHKATINWGDGTCGEACVRGRHIDHPQSIFDRWGNLRSGKNR